MTTYAYIGAFGLLGVFARYLLGNAIDGLGISQLPLGTLAVNLLGAFAVGAVSVYGIDQSSISPELKVGLMVGLLGGFTTFSAYGLQTVQLANEGKLFHAALYVLLSNGLGLLCVVAGMALARHYR